MLVLCGIDAPCVETTDPVRACASLRACQGVRSLDRILVRSRLSFFTTFLPFRSVLCAVGCCSHPVDAGRAQAESHRCATLRIGSDHLGPEKFQLPMRGQNLAVLS